MDYEEKYKEALERARKLQKTCDNTAVIGWCEYIFPELKESENEKIRKALIEMVHDTTYDELWVDYNVHKEEALAWLEKQGEKKPFDYENANIQQKDFAPQEDAPRYSIGDVLCDKSCTTLNKDAQPNYEIVDIRNGLYICDKGYIPISQQDEYELVAKKIEQKPADKDMIEALRTEYEKGRADAIAEMQKGWSKVDEERIKNIISFLDWDGATGKKGNPYQKEVDWLYSLKNRVQPKQEWSEEDEEFLRRAINVAKDKYPMTANWLKSLKQRIGG